MKSFFERNLFVKYFLLVYMFSLVVFMFTTYLKDIRPTDVTSYAILKVDRVYVKEDLCIKINPDSSEIFCTEYYFIDSKGLSHNISYKEALSLDKGSYYKRKTDVVRTYPETFSSGLYTGFFLLLQFIISLLLYIFLSRRK